MIPDELLLNDFAVRCFRDVADADYIAARMTFRAGLVTQYLWASQQAIEKYLKGILLLNRIPAPNVKHQLDLALSKINNSGKLRLDLTQGTKTFIKYVNTYGPFRYLENSPFVFGGDVVRLDRAIWEIRRYCTLSKDGRQVRLKDGETAPLVRLETGFLEQVIDDPKHAAREPLLWQNAFFGKRARRRVRIGGLFRAINSPLFSNPHIVDEVSKYVFLPEYVQEAYRTLRDTNRATGRIFENHPLAEYIKTP